MSKRTWTGEELQQHLDQWDEQMQRGVTLDMSLTTRATIDPFKQEDYILTCGDEHVALTITQAMMVQRWFQAHMEAHRAVPARPRDTQFAGFAKLLWQELMQKTTEEWEQISRFGSAMDDTEYITVIARRAYDFANHIREWADQCMPLSEALDMTAWPKDDEA